MVLLFQHRALQADQPSHQDAVPGKIIFISGSCSSGKSSLAKIVAQKLDAQMFAFDDYVMPLILKKFITKHYGKIMAFFISGLVMRNFFTTINFLSEKRKYAFQLKFYNDLQHGLAEEPTSQMYREVRKTAQQGKNVVVEAPLYLWGGVDLLSSLAEFEGADITYVLTYCPWNQLIQRITQRNATKNKKNYRELDWVVGNYMHTFTASRECREAPLLEMLDGTAVHNVIIEYSQRHYKKKHLCLLHETQQIATQKFSRDTMYHLYPRFEYDIIINTGDHTPEQGASTVLAALNQHNQDNFQV
jgi:chloramphenicol 3-O-phosphotransferase